jgi:hypothetical protein
MSLFSVNKDDFARAMQKALAAKGISVQYDPDKFCLTLGDGSVAPLINAYNDYRAASIWQRGATLRRLVEGFKEIKEAPLPTPEEARKMLMPRLRERIYWEKIKASSEAKGTPEKFAAPRIIGGGHLTLWLVLDSDHAIKYLASACMDELGLVGETANAIAATNLKLRHGGFEVVQPGLYRSMWKDNYDATRLVYNEFFENLPLKGRPVAMVPNRDCLLVTSEQDSEGLVKMASIAAEELNHPRPMTGLAFRQDAGWVPFLPAKGHPAYPALKAMQVNEMGRLYQVQRERLSKDHSSGVSKVFPTPFVAGDNSEGDYVSFTVWPVGSLASLPKTDEIMLMQPTGSDGEAKSLGYAAWDTVAAVMGDCFEVIDVYPERFKVSNFPTAEQLAAINARPKL